MQDLTSIEPLKNSDEKNGARTYICTYIATSSSKRAKSQRKMFRAAQDVYLIKSFNATAKKPEQGDQDLILRP
jgi:hypothetical protein